MVGVAQLVEHQVVALVAVGSSPITHPIYLRFDSCSSGWSYRNVKRSYHAVTRGVKAGLAVQLCWLNWGLSFRARSYVRP